jgi:hypothetical protein
MAVASQQTASSKMLAPPSSVDNKKSNHNLLGHFIHVFTVHHFHFHFIAPTGALNIKRDLTLQSLFQHPVLKHIFLKTEC